MSMRRLRSELHLVAIFVYRGCMFLCECSGAPPLLYFCENYITKGKCLFIWWIWNFDFVVPQYMENISTVCARMWAQESPKISTVVFFPTADVFTNHYLNEFYSELGRKLPMIPSVRSKPMTGLSSIYISVNCRLRFKWTLMPVLALKWPCFQY